MSIFTGSAVALVTPYTPSGIDFTALERLIEFQIDSGTDAIVVAGTTGEAATMTEMEYHLVIQFVVQKVNGRIPVIAGTGSNSTLKAIENSKFAEAAGVDGLLIVTPYYNKGTQKSIVAHYEAIASQVNIPIIAYNVPSRTGLNILPETAKQLANIKNVVGLKEASGDMSQITEVLRICPKHFDVYSGNDDTIIPVLAIGGKGVISVVANILPKETKAMVTQFFNGNVESARDGQLKMNGLVNALFVETNPVPIKHAMNLMGLKAGQVRLPLLDMSVEARQILENEMFKYGLCWEVAI